MHRIALYIWLGVLPSCASPKLYETKQYCLSPGGNAANLREIYSYALHEALALVRMKSTSFTLSVTVTPTARKLILLLWFMKHKQNANVNDLCDESESDENNGTYALTALTLTRSQLFATTKKWQDQQNLIMFYLARTLTRTLQFRCFRVTSRSLNERSKFRIYNVFRVRQIKKGKQIIRCISFRLSPWIINNLNRMCYCS